MALRFGESPANRTPEPRGRTARPNGTAEGQPGQALSMEAREMRPSITSNVAMVSVETPALITCSCATTQRVPNSTLVSITQESSGFCRRGS